jgi:transcriptional regulator with XRE-family HTH domain
MRHTQERVTTSVRVEMALRREHQSDLARALGLTQTSVSARLNGRTRWSVDDLDKLAEHFGVTVADLVNPPRAYLRGTGTSGESVTQGNRRGRIGGSVLTLPLPRTSFEQVAA